jgi:hypothetical protein
MCVYSILETSLTPSPFIAVPKPRQESDQLFIYVNGIDCASVSMIFLLDSRNILT